MDKVTDTTQFTAQRSWFWLLLHSQYKPITQSPQLNRGIWHASVAATKMYRLRQLGEATPKDVKHYMGIIERNLLHLFPEESEAVLIYNKDGHVNEHPFRINACNRTFYIPVKVEESEE